MSEYSPKNYFDNGATVPAKADLGADRMARLRSGEIFTVLKEDGSPDRRILMDSFDTIRRSVIDNPDQPLAQALFGVVPPHPTILEQSQKARLTPGAEIPRPVGG